MTQIQVWSVNLYLREVPRAQSELPLNRNKFDFGKLMTIFGPKGLAF